MARVMIGAVPAAIAMFILGFIFYDEAQDEHCNGGRNRPDHHACHAEAPLLFLRN